MGTNYYLRAPRDGTLISSMAEPIHIAKLSARWRACFESYQVNSQRWPRKSVSDHFKVDCVADVKSLIAQALGEGWTFCDEYSQTVDVDWFFDQVESRQSQRSHCEGEIDWVDGKRPATYLNFVSHDGYDFSYGPFS